MPLSKKHTDYTFESITPIVYKTLSLDRVFTNLLPWIKYDGYPIRSGGTSITSVATLAQLLAREGEALKGFDGNERLIEEWLKSDLVDLVNRGKKGTKQEKYAAPVPLNINTYKLKNKGETFDYGVAKQVFALLHYGAPKALQALREFLSEGSQPQTDKYDGSDIDIEWLVIMRMLDHTAVEEPDRTGTRDVPIPHCIGQGRIMGDDIRRLLAYGKHMPRRVLIDALKSIIALHVTLYMFRLIRIVPYMAQHNAQHPTCKECHVHTTGTAFAQVCAFKVPLIVDLGDAPRKHIAELARQSYNDQVVQHDVHIRAQIRARKIYELALSLDERFGGERENLDLPDLFGLPDTEDLHKVSNFFARRIDDLVESTGDTGDGAKTRKRELRYGADIKAIERSGMSEVDQYVEMLYVIRQAYHQSFFERMLESLLQRNTDHCLLKSGLGSINKKRFAIGSQLLENLVHIALLDPDHKTRPLRLDQFTTWLEDRYGIYTVRPPKEDSPNISDLVAFRENSEQFSSRMRDIGFYRTLSDAYISQTIRPRYIIT